MSEITMSDADIVRVAKEKTRDRRNSYLRQAISHLKIACDDCTEPQILMLCSMINDLRRIMESEVG